MELPIYQQVHAFAGGIDQRACDGCDECGTRCTGGIRILQSEFEALRAELQRLPQAEVARVLGQTKELPIPGTDVTYTACQFRDVERGRCLVYRARPLICRLFGHVEWLPCPIARVTTVAEGAVSVMQAYATQPRKTYDEWLEDASSGP